MRTHIDLFSGIGGFALAAEMVWPDIQHVFCDNDPFSQAILKKHWPAAPIYGDIRTLTANAEERRLEGREVPVRQRRPHEAASNSDGRGRRASSHSDSNGREGAYEVHTAEAREQAQRLAARRCACSVYLLTGGFPCQPFSQAGRRRGTEDDRYLWPEMLRVIREFHPQWIIGENVGGFVTWNDGMVLEQVQSDLENEGYEVQAFVIPAAAVNAPHRRDRVWIVAHASGKRIGGGPSAVRTTKRGPDNGSVPKCEHTNSDALHPIGKHGRSSKGEKVERYLFQKSQRQEGADTSNRSGINAANPAKRGRGKGEPVSKGTRKGTGAPQERHRSANSDTAWGANWLEVATRLCAVDDGLPNGLARPRGWRNAALKGAGNAIVPQVAAEIMRAIKYADE